MKTSKRGINLIKQCEGLRTRAYRCPAGHLTIGYGHTGPDVKVLSTVTEAEAEALLITDLHTAEAAIVRFIKPALTQNQYDALVSLIFNIGVNAFGNSTLLKKVNRNPYDPAIEHEFKRWVFAQRKKLPGLVVRRQKEAELYFTPV